MRRKIAATVLLTGMAIGSLFITPVAVSYADTSSEIIVDEENGITINLDVSSPQVVTQVVDLSGVMSKLGSIQGTLSEQQVLLEDIQEKTGKTYDTVEELLKAYEEDRELLKAYVPVITTVYSVNNALKGDAYYNPRWGEIPYIEAAVMQGGFASVYTDFYDISTGSSMINSNTVAITHYDEKKTVNESGNSISYACRELEILGYDYLLQSESYEDGKYVAIPIKDMNALSQELVVMNIYKALGRYQYDIQVSYSKDSNCKNVNNIPHLENLFSIFKKVDYSRAKADVFVTRTKSPDAYFKTYERDFGTSDEDTEITYREFIVLVAEMMDFYGEPVISEAEENELLQVYGATVPYELTAREKSAYCYLKARGIWNIEVSEWNDSLSFMDMINVLMCVKDEGSRTDYKEIQIVKSVPTELKNLGYFVKDISIVESSGYIDEYVDYEAESGYDYFLVLDTNTTFKKNGTGSSVSPYVSADNGSNSQSTWNVVLSGSEYLGIEVVGSKKCYHFRVPANVTHDIYINSPNQDDNPTKVRLEVGGGYYRYNMSDGGVLLTDRYTFDEMRLPNYVDRERVLATEERKESTAPAEVASNIARRLRSLFEEKIYTAYADEASNNPLSDKGVALTDTLYQALTLVWGTEGKSILLDYDELVDAGICYYTVSGEIPIPVNEDYLTIDTKNGMVRVNNETKEISVGNVIYRVKSSSTTPLFYYQIDDNGKQKLYIDFRVAYGWSGNEAEITIDGNGESMWVTMRKVDNTSTGYVEPIGSVNVTVAGKVHDEGNASKEKVFFRKKTNAGGDNAPMLLLNSKYSLANWVLYQMANAETDTSEDYLIIYYHKKSFEAAGLEAPNDIALVKELIGYSIDIPEQWCCRCIKLDIDAEDFKQLTGIEYHQQYGYVYKLPYTGTKNDVEYYTRYLQGNEYNPEDAADTRQMVLPLGIKGNQLINYNINPVDGVMVSKISDWFAGLKPFNIYAAPAGVSKFYGWYGVVANKFSDTAMSIYETDSLYYGTMHLVKNDNGDWCVEYIDEPTVEIQDNTYAYLAGRERVLKDGLPTNDYNSIFVCFGENVHVMGDMSSSSEGLHYIDVEVIDAEDKDVFTQYAEFSWEGLVEGLDGFSYYMIMLVLEIFPIIGYVLLIILLALSFLSSSKFVQAFAAKVFDPVKILTFGRRNIQNFKVSECIVSVILGATIFALIYKGNLLTVIEWALRIYKELTDLVSKI